MATHKYTIDELRKMSDQMLQQLAKITKDYQTQVNIQKVLIERGK